MRTIVTIAVLSVIGLSFGDFFAGNIADVFGKILGVL
jgi:hypothetical protein